VIVAKAQVMTIELASAAPSPSLTLSNPAARPRRCHAACGQRIKKKYSVSGIRAPEPKHDLCLLITSQFGGVAPYDESQHCFGRC
jgi:hypothetical protein